MHPHPMKAIAGLAALAFAAAAATALAQTDPRVARDMAATCANCHGTGGVSRGVNETLAGKPRDELVRKLAEFKAGTRPGTIMPQLAKGFTDEQLAAIAGYFSEQPSR